MSYNTEQDLIDYAAGRAYTLIGAPSVLLTKAMDWLDTQQWNYTTRALIEANEVPDKIKTAQLVAAVLIDQGEDLFAPIGQRVTSEAVSGAVSVTYSDKGNQTTLYPQLMALLRGYVVGGSGIGFVEVKRA